MQHNKMLLTNEMQLDEYIIYLEQSLIPDLHESGNTATAEEFEVCVEAINSLLDRLTPR